MKTQISNIYYASMVVLSKPRIVKEDNEAHSHYYHIITIWKTTLNVCQARCETDWAVFFLELHLCACGSVTWHQVQGGGSGLGVHLADKRGSGHHIQDKQGRLPVDWVLVGVGDLLRFPWVAEDRGDWREENAGEKMRLVMNIVLMLSVPLALPSLILGLHAQ